MKVIEFFFFIKKKYIRNLGKIFIVMVIKVVSIIIYKMMKFILKNIFNNIYIINVIVSFVGLFFRLFFREVKDRIFVVDIRLVFIKFIFFLIWLYS